MQNELDIVRDVSSRLEHGGIAYMLTGSMAMNYHAQPRMTRDMTLLSPWSRRTQKPFSDFFIRITTSPAMR